ncbi:hypothetical protein MLD38_035373 [Melastoma candidum]|uniref:Uncharacterized protein n=1 Tax=Melastoma candidum TaxID=119954 RepID=A0ACB9LHN3_9MYRT|nr:hypothetical protein MLD38_035373 [Melastoma candidum]
MAKKRKSTASRLDEVDRSLYASFCSAANSLSQLYTHSMTHQRLSFQAGERHSLDKLYHWILRQQEDGARVSTADIISYLQNELEYAPEDTPMSPRMPFPLQHSQTTIPPSNPILPFSSSPFTPATIGPTQRPAPGQGDHQGKNSVFSNALSSPVRRTLQHYHSTQGGGVRNVEESPGQDSHY